MNVCRYLEKNGAACHVELFGISLDLELFSRVEKVTDTVDCYVDARAGGDVLL